MKKEMENSWLIQRLRKPIDRDRHAFGGGLRNGGMSDENMVEIRKVFSFDYMGAIEYEDGSVAKAINEIVANVSDFITGSVDVDWEHRSYRSEKVENGNDTVYYFCHKDHEEEIKKRISDWAIGEDGIGKAHEHLYLNTAFVDDTHRGWLELDNGFFFFVDEEMFKGVLGLFDVPDSD